MEDQDIRWKQRFSNFEKATTQLQAAINNNELSELEKAGVIQIFEFTFELAWKTIKDYLEEKEVEVKFPKDVIKQAFKYEIIEDGMCGWICLKSETSCIIRTMKQKRNLPLD